LAGAKKREYHTKKKEGPPAAKVNKYRDKSTMTSKKEI
jgi:hypothetical protein